MATYSPSKITKDGNTYNFTDTTKIPLTGTNELAGSIIPDTDFSYDLGSSSNNLKRVFTHVIYNGLNYKSISISGGDGTSNGAHLILYGIDRTDGFRGRFDLVAKGTSDYKLTGISSTLTWNGSAIVTSSDSRLKDDINSISDEVLDAWENLEPKQYKLKSDLENDKENAQVHYGWIAQEVESVIKGDRKGEVKNGLWLHEEWEEQEEVSHEETYTEEVQTKSGETETVTKTRKVIDTPYRAKGDSYGLRYAECLVVECAFLRKKLKELTARIEQLEKGNNTK